MAKLSRYYETKEFKKLNDEWAKKLEESGFKDIEQPQQFKSGAEDGKLKQWSATFFSSPSRFNLTQFQSKEEYYRLAGQFLYDYSFRNDDERYMWELHTEGLPLDAIITTLKAKKIHKVCGRKLGLRLAREIITSLTAAMLERLKK